MMRYLNLLGACNDGGFDDAHHVPCLRCGTDDHDDGGGLYPTYERA